MATTANTTAAPPTTATTPIETNHDNNMDIDPTQAAALVEQQTPKRKRKDKALEKEKGKEKLHILHQSTFRKPLWTYFHLSLTTPTTASRETNNDSKSTTSPSNGISPPALDALTASSLLTPPLTSYLGLTGSSIPIDILKTAGRDVWIRLPRQDARAFQASLSGWIGACEADLIPGVGAVDGENGTRVKVAWRVVKRAEYLGFLVGEGSGDGLGLFEG